MNARDLMKERREATDYTYDDALVFMNFFNATANMARLVHRRQREKGFWEDRDKAAGQGQRMRLMAKLEALALVHSEVSEAVEGLRKDLQDDHLPHYTQESCELADTLIRILDYAEGFNVPLCSAFIAKMEYNESRPHKHGKEA